MSDLIEFLRTHEEAFRSRNRLQSLYSDFRLQRTSNPDGYQANSTAWMRALKSAARAGRLPATQPSGPPSHVAFGSGDQLSRALNTQQWGRPLALGAVINDAVERQELVPLNDFLNATKSIYAKSWVPSPWQVMNWGLKQMFGPADKLAVGNMVVMANVEEAANAIMTRASQSAVSLTSRIYSRDLFESEFALALDPTADKKVHPEAALSSTDFSILLKYLSRDKALISYDDNTIKLKAPGQAQPDPITQQDTDIANLRTLITTLESQVDQLTTRIKTLDITARQAVAAKHSHQAKSALRSKKLAETTMQTRSDTLAQLEQVYTRIETAADQVSIVRVMESSGNVLRELHNQVGGVEGVEAVVDRLKDEMENVDEVGRVLNEANTSVDEAEVDDEFEALERAEKERLEKEEAEKTAERLKELDRLEEKREEEEEEEKKKEEEERKKEEKEEKMKDGEGESRKEEEEAVTA